MKSPLSILLALVLLALPFLAVAEAATDAFGAVSLESPQVDDGDTLAPMPVATGQCEAVDFAATDAPLLSVYSPASAQSAPDRLRSARESRGDGSEQMWLTMADAEPWRTGICSSA